MNRKHIARRLEAVFQDFCSSIKDENVRKLVEVNTIIAGGAIVSLLQGENPNDYDIYFRNKETVLAVSKYYVKQFNDNNKITNNLGYEDQKAFVIDGAKDIKEQIESNGEKPWYSRMLYNLTEDRVKIIVRSDGVAADSYDKLAELIDEADELPIEPKKKKEKKKKYRPIFLSTNAITLSDNIQVIARFYGEPEEIFSTYDFVHCCNHWASWDQKKVHATVESLESILNKQLIYRGSKYPLCSIFRIRKFINRGWTVNAGQILKMGFQLSQLDLSNPDVLEDQLIGVDTLYFKHFVNIMREAQERADGEFQVTEDYVTTIIDRVFG